MPSQFNSYLKKCLITCHRSILNRVLRKELLKLYGDILVVGAGHDPYGSLINKSAFVVRSDLFLFPTTIDIVTNARSMPFANKSFDAVVAIEVLEHILEFDEVLNECSRVLSDSGRMILSVPFMFPYHPDPYDFARYTPDYLNAYFLRYGFKSIDIYPFGSRICVIFDILSTSGIKAFYLLRIFSIFFSSRKIDSNAVSGFFVVAQK